MADHNKVFISYSHEDVRYLNRLRVHLRPLERDHVIEVWDDTRISPGTEWREAISDALSSAKVGILLISADFLASDFIVNNELPPLLEAASSSGTTILSVILSPSRFQLMPELSRYQVVNSPNKPLSKLPLAEKEAVWVKVANSVEAALEERDVTEGWLVRNERILFGALRTLVHEGEDEAFLVVGAEDYYVQFLLELEDGDKKLYSEAVSNAYLPPRLRLDEEAAERLIDMGFREQPDEDSNFHRTYELDGTDEQLREIVSTSIEVLADVYEVSERVSLDINLDLEG
jgi:hypothetical protein